MDSARLARQIAAGRLARAVPGASRLVQFLTSPHEGMMIVWLQTGGLTTAQELDEWGAALVASCARFDGVFGRTESRAQARKYLRVLLSSVWCKNGWQLAEAMSDAVPDPMQRLLYRCRAHASQRHRAWLETQLHARLRNKGGDFDGWTGYDTAGPMATNARKSTAGRTVKTASASATA